MGSLCRSGSIILLYLLIYTMIPLSIIFPDLRNDPIVYNLVIKNYKKNF